MKNEDQGEDNGGDESDEKHWLSLLCKYSDSWGRRDGFLFLARSPMCRIEIYELGLQIVTTEFLVGACKCRERIPIDG